jgi:hypothetical protein
MKLRNFLLFSIAALSTVTFVNTSFAQQDKYVLFETFTGPAAPTCIPQDETAYENAAFEGGGSTASVYASKIVHINYYLSTLIPGGLDINGGAVDQRLSGSSNGPIYISAVNRSIFPENSSRVDRTSSDWGTEIVNNYSNDPNNNFEATVTLNFATIDKSDSAGAAGYMRLHADMTVTANQDISDEIIIRYAITQDGVKVHECGDANSDSIVFNDMAWYVSTDNSSGYIVCNGSTGMAANATKHMTWDHLIDVSDHTNQHPDKMKFVAFLEDQDGSGGYNVVNAAILKQDLDTLQPPPPTLAITSNTIDGSTLTPGSVADIYYVSTSLYHGVNASYSLDNGAHWLLIGDSETNPVIWTVPNSVTTQGKIQLVAVGFPNLVSEDTGHFSIAVAASAGFTHPLSNQVIKGNAPDTVQWVQSSGITGDSLLYSLDNGAHFHFIGHTADTFMIWHVPDTNALAELQLIPDNKEAPAAFVFFDTIKSLVQGVSNTVPPSSLAITNVFPNPAMNGAEIVVQYTEALPKQVTLQFLDLLGHTLPQSYSSEGEEIHLNTSSLMPGAYIVRLSDGLNTVSKRVEVIR